MSGVSLLSGNGRLLLDYASRTPATPFKVYTDPYRLLEGGGLEIILDITSVGGGASIGELNIQSESAGNYDTVIPNAGLGLTAPGRYSFLFAPFASEVLGYTVSLSTYPPTVGRIEIVHADDRPIAYGIRLRALRS